MDHLQEFERLLTPRPESKTIGRFPFQAIDNVLDHVQPGKQRVLLEHHQSIVSRPAHGVALEQDISCRRRFKARNQIEQRGFAAARRPEQDHVLAFADFEVHRLQRRHLLRGAVERLGDIRQPQFDRRRNARI